MKDSILRDKSFAFAVDIVNEMHNIQHREREFVLSRQLLRSGTAIGAMIREGGRAESAADFIHKMAIANKEADESLYWIELMHATGLMDETTMQRLSAACDELIRMLTASIKTTKQNHKNK